MSKYATGNYIITLFDSYGSRIASVPAMNSTLTGARQEADELIDTVKYDAVIKSVAVTRVLYNSVEGTSAPLSKSIRYDKRNFSDENNSRDRDGIFHIHDEARQCS